VERYLAALEHEEIVVRRGRRSGLYSFIAVHSTQRGPALGGCRLWPYDDARLALRDVLRLSAAMTLKAAVADLPLGGGKGVIRAEPGTRLDSRRRRAALLDFADTVEALGGRYLTAEDVGVSSRDMTVILQRTAHVTGLARRRGGSGDPSPMTALGVHEGIVACVERVFGAPSMAQRSVAVVGLGHVGSRLARRLARQGARLVVADLDPGKRPLADELGARWVSSAQALRAPVDVLAPCALGAVLDHETVTDVRAPIVAGAANNQLADDGLADVLAAGGILWAPDFVINAGGLIHIAAELAPGGYDARRARAAVRGVGVTMRRLLDDAERTGSTPLAAALALARERLEPP